MRTTLDAARSIKRYVALGLGSEWEVRLNSEEGAYKRPFCRIDLPGATNYAQAGSHYTDIDLTAALVLYPEESSTATEALFKAMEVENRLYEITQQGLAYLSPVGTVSATKQATGDLVGDFRYVVCAKNRYGKTTASEPVEVTSVEGRVKLTWAPYPEATSYQVFRGTHETPAGREQFLFETDDEQTIDGLIYDNGSVLPTPNTRPPYTNTAKVSGPMRIPLYDYSEVSINQAVTDVARDRNDYLRITEPPAVSRLSDDQDDLMWVVAATIRMSWRRSSGVLSDLPLIRSINTSEDVA